MKFIPFETIESISEELSQYSDAALEGLVEQFSQEQPALMSYLMDIYEEDLDEDERELLFFTGLQIWHIYKEVFGSLPTIESESIEEVEMDHEDMLSYLSEESEEGFANFADTLIEDYPQGDLLQFVLISIVEEEVEEEPLIYEDNKGLFFIALKIIIDILQKNITKTED